MAAAQASANGVPVSLVERVIKRESGGNPRAVSRGNYGLMQIRLGTARAMGFSGSAAELLDPQVNMTYAVRYLAGAYRAAGGNENRAVALYASGYYYQAKAQGFSPYAAEASSGFAAYRPVAFQMAENVRQRRAGLSRAASPASRGVAQKSPLPACGERSSEARVRGPLSEFVLGSLCPAERPPHPNLLPARGEKERACVSVTASTTLQRRDRAHLDQKLLLHQAVDDQAACWADRRRRRTVLEIRGCGRP